MKSTLKMKVGISTHLFSWRELEQSHLKDIAASGFRAIELWCSREHLGYHKPGHVQEVLRWISDAGLEVVSLHAPFYFSIAEARAGRFITLSSSDSSVRNTAREEIEMVLKNIRMERPLPMVLHTGFTDSGHFPQSQEHFLKGLRELLPLFKRSGLLAAIENGPRPSVGCDVIAELVQRTGSEDVGICLDTGHSNIAGSLLEDLAICAPRLLDVHVHDNNGAQDRHMLPFQGNIPWAEFTAALQATGYGGHFMMETAGDDEPHRFLKETAACMDKLGLPLQRPSTRGAEEGEPPV